ncbi:MAG: DUF2478 domain-containing protein [Bacteroidales bacterium]|nr:DUF2478 domain-containing protein [Bacteroidales bacterium]
MNKDISVTKNDKWLKAAVIGSLWASIEIILGSFLHNLRVPFSGTFLTFIAICLLISFHQMWKENGIFWRAGLICALMKSISPSAIIFGPMIGILTGAIVLELFVFIIGKNIIAYILGGIFAMLSVIIHKIIGLLILYGTDLVKIVENLYHYAVKQINIEDISPLNILILIILIYSISGIIAVMFGYIIGKRTAKYKNPIISNKYNLVNKNSDFISENATNNSVWLLFFHIITIISGIYIIGALPLNISIVSVGVYITFCFYRYKNSMRRLTKPLFLIQLLILTLFAGLFWNGFQKSEIFRIEGFIIGIKMVIRAVMIVVGFFSLSVELRNPVVKTILHDRGFSQLYFSLNLAFAALPSIISGMPKPRRFISNPINSFTDALLKSHDLLNTIKKQENGNPKIFIITGERHQGKTTFVRQIVTKLKEKEFSVKGFLSEAIFTDGERTGYVLKDIETNKSVEICNINGNSDWNKTGCYYFNPDGIQFGYDILDIKKIKNSDIIVIDEIGKFELNNEGWKKAIDNLLINSKIPMIWVVRKSLVSDVITKWNLSVVEIFDIKKNKIEDIIEKQVKKVK